MPARRLEIDFMGKPRPVCGLPTALPPDLPESQKRSAGGIQTRYVISEGRGEMVAGDRRS
jgi:hypothetical protein